MKKIITALIIIISLIAFTACGGGGTSGGEGGGNSGDGGASTSGKVDPFDPAIFDVEEGGIVFNFKVDTSIYGENYITDVKIENQLPEDDIRSTFEYELTGDDLEVGDRVTVEVTAPDEFWEENDMTATSIDYTIPPVPCAWVNSDLITEEVVREHLSEITEGLGEVVDGKYYDNQAKTGSVKDLVDTENIYFEGRSHMYVMAKAKEPDENGETVYVKLGQVHFTYDQNKDLVAIFCHWICDDSGETYYTRNEEHLIPCTDDTDWIVVSDSEAEEYADEISYADELSPSDRHLYVEYTHAEPKASYSYNCNTGELTTLSE